MGLNNLPEQVFEISIRQWLGAGLNLPEPLPRNETKTPFQLNVSTLGASRVEVIEVSNGTFVTSFKTTESVSETTSTLEKIYLNHLDVLTLNKVRLVFDSQDDSLKFSFQGKQFILSEFSHLAFSEPYQSFLIPAISLMPEVLQLVVNLIKHLNENPIGIVETEAFPGGMLEPLEVNKYLILPDIVLLPTLPDTSLCWGSSHCIPLSQYAWLVYSGHGKAAIISDPYSSDEPMDGKKRKGGKGGKGKKIAYTSVPLAKTGFQFSNIGNGGIGTGSGSGDNDPPERETDYSITPPADKNEFEDDDTRYYQVPTDDEAEELDAQARSDQERTGNALLTRDAVQGRRNGRQLLDVVGGEAEGTRQSPPNPPAPPEATVVPNQEPTVTETTVNTFDTNSWIPDDGEEIVVNPDPGSKGQLPKGMSSRERDTFINIDDI
ncbi:hypothetical protein GZ78_15450 [Endozoicomonas numazuensis]|uniref:Uncharacterized protein n=2 Tax=Endozoicomonas numazuensis TaxID=1137799 RepID=A0A081NDY4_9GAMM|nr:hypothetical protein GZ78_22870 [Endozoicomonas numazuensis]KEQ17225.1 hypothetical protein GZ78_15450 [Endozoicomonas numazuensis]